MKRKAFTLIEIMIVVIILGIVIVLAIPKYDTWVIRSRGAEAKVMLNALSDSIWRYYIESGEFPLIPDGQAHDPPDVLDAKIPASTKYFRYSYTHIAGVYVTCYAWDKEVEAAGGPENVPVTYQITYWRDITTFNGQSGQKIDSEWRKFYTYSVYVGGFGEMINGW